MKLKKLLTITLSLFCSVAMLVGCNLVELNTAKYYNQVVITVGDDVEYTKKDLIDAYYNYYYSYVASGNMDAKQAVQNSAKMLVQRGLVVDYIKTNFFGEGKPLEITDLDEQDIRMSAFNSMQNQIDELEATIRHERGIEIEESTDTEEETTESLRDEYVSYTPTVVLVDGVAVYNEELDDQNQGNSALDIPLHFEQKITDVEISREAMTRYVASLQSTAKMLGKSTDEKEVVIEEEERLIEIYTEQKYLEKYQEYFNKSSKFNDNNELIDTTKVLEYYTKEYKRQQELYEGNLTKYYNDMKSNSESVIYHPSGSENSFMNVTHILLQFSDEQKAEVTKLKKEKETTNMSDETYQTKLELIANRTEVVYEENGVEFKSNPQTVYQRIYNYVNQSNDPVVRAQLFNDMIYKYNDDPGIMNKEFDYVVDLNDDVYGVDSEGNPTNIMVREFTEAARALYDTTDTLNYGAGSMSELVITEHGYHIIMNTGAVRNVTNDINSLDYQALFNTYTQLNHAKNLFNYYYDLIVTDDYQTQEEDLTELASANVKVVYYENRYKDLWK